MLYVVYGILGLVGVYALALTFVTLFVGRTLPEGKKWLRSTDEVEFEQGTWLPF